MEQPKTYRVMDGGEWAWLLIFTYLRAIYLAHGGWAVVAAAVIGAIPFVGIAVWAWGLIVMHDVFGCKTSLTAFGVWLGIGILFFVAAVALG